jgi:bifunctional DNA-binding transcriptional regulator/antitoxin component of YhaV-PrlF toxin-antitoxin module
MNSYYPSNCPGFPRTAVRFYTSWQTFPESIACNAFLHYDEVTKGCAMTTLTVTARGQVTLRKRVLQHLGIKPGEKVALELLPDGRGLLRAAKPSGSIDGFLGLLANRTKKVATVEEMNEAAARGWAGKK